MANKKEAKKVKKCGYKGTATLLILGGMFVGIGCGMILGNTGAGTVIGLGLGFIAAFGFIVTRK